MTNPGVRLSSLPACKGRQCVASGALSVRPSVQSTAVRARWKPLCVRGRYGRLPRSPSARHCNDFFTAGGQEVLAGQAGALSISLAATTSAQPLYCYTRSFCLSVCMLPTTISLISFSRPIARLRKSDCGVSRRPI